MDFVITFFRDILDGPLYIIVAIISGILICSCIGYLAERSINKKKEKQKYEQEHYEVNQEEQTNSNRVENNAVQQNISNNNINDVQDSVTVNANMNAIPQSISNTDHLNQVQQPLPELPNNIQQPSTNINNSTTIVNPMQNIDK